MKLISIIAMLLLSSQALSADYQSEIDSFFKAYRAGEINKAIDGLYSTNPYVSSVPDQMTQIKSQLNSLSSLVGTINTVTKIDVFNLNDSIVHVTYLVTYDRQPIRFEFQYFKVDSGWRIYSLSFDDDIDDEIKMMARKSALKMN